jgi:hypothetical protein
MWLARLRPCLIEFGSNVVSTRSIFVSGQHMSERFSVLNFFGSPMIFGQLWGGYSGADVKAANFPCRSLLQRKSRRAAQFMVNSGSKKHSVSARDLDCSKMTSNRPPSKNVRALEWTYCFSASLIIPAVWRQSAFMTMRAADAASLIRKINSLSRPRCMIG